MPVVTPRARLTDSDIRTLIKGPSDVQRAEAAHKICRCIEEAELSAEERSHAEAIMGIMAEDAAVLVRRALAVALKSSPRLPREIANKLVRDMESIALPVILNSPALSDGDPVEIVRSLPEASSPARPKRVYVTLPASASKTRSGARRAFMASS